MSQTKHQAEGPRVSQERIDALMNSLTIKAFSVPDTTMTVALATLPNGFVVARGESACVSPQNFDAARGIELAVADAKAKAKRALWDYEGYALAMQVHEAKQPKPRQHKLIGLTFGEAVEAAKDRFRIARRGWNGTGMHVAIQEPNALSKMGRAYLYMRTVDGSLVPWVASQTDILAGDWYLVV